MLNEQVVLVSDVLRQVGWLTQDNGIRVTVKASEGRRYTAAARLVLERRQPTRGRFYLFALYEVNSGRTRWAFRPGKGAADVCGFMRRVRR